MRPFFGSFLIMDFFICPPRGVGAVVSAAVGGAVPAAGGVEAGGAISTLTCFSMNESLTTDKLLCGIC